MTKHPPNRLFDRRRFLAASAGTVSAFWGFDARGGPPDALDATVLSLPVGRRSSRKALVLKPRGPLRKGGRPVLVLLHGLGETASESLGLHAWSDHYGLVDADARLRRGSVAPETPNRYLSEARALAIDQELRQRPYNGPILVCPVTPNVYKGGATYTALDEYAAWISDTLLPAVRETAGVRRDPAATAIDGCSLGGYIAIEVFLRKPEAFGALGSVQAAIGERMAFVYAERLRATLDRVGLRQIHIESSVWDPSRKAHEVLSAQLDKLGVPHELTVLPGGHDQSFLREVGSLEMLLWHDRRIS
jgi:predicted esterase